MGPSLSFATILGCTLRLGLCFQGLDSKDKFKVQNTQQILKKQEGRKDSQVAYALQV